MNELISINYNSEQPTVLGRDLHEAFEVKTAYKDWFPRMCEYGFEDGKDYILVAQKRATNNPKNPYTNITNHQLTIPMAKEICMLQRSDKGREFRQYFIKIEEQWNTPEAVMARALKFANQKLAEIQQNNLKLTEKVAIQEQQIIEMQPKVTYYDIVLNCKDLVTITTIAKDYGKSGQWMNETLHELGIQYKQGKIWLLYQKHAEQGYTSTKTSIYDGTDGEKHTSVHTYWTQKGRLFIYDTLKANGILPLIECSED